MGVNNKLEIVSALSLNALSYESIHNPSPRNVDQGFTRQGEDFVLVCVFRIAICGCKLEVIHTDIKGSFKLSLNIALSHCHTEINWITTTYNCDNCFAWLEHAKQVQARVSDLYVLRHTQTLCVYVMSRPLH